MAKPNRTSETEVEDIIARFPGPITLAGSRLKAWFLIIAGAAMTAACAYCLVDVVHHPPHVESQFLMLLSFLGFGTFFFGLGPIAGIIFLCRSALRLDRDGFEATALYRQRYRWSEVTDFSVFRYKSAESVMFKTTKLQRSSLEKLNALLTGGRNAGLPETYGFGASELMKLMKTWQGMATRATD